MASIYDLPYELICIINDNLQNRSSAHLGQTCRFLQNVIEPKLYQRAKDEIGIMCWAIERGYVGAVKKLIAAGADVNSIWAGEVGHQPMNPTVINYLPQPSNDSFIDPHSQHGPWIVPGTAVHDLAYYHEHVLRISHNAVGSVTHGVRTAMTKVRHAPIHLAVSYGNDDLVNILLDHGANINMLSMNLCRCQPLLPLADLHGHEWTSLHIAMCHNRLSTMKLLMERGASFRVCYGANGTLDHKITALHDVCTLGDTAMIDEILHHYRPDINFMDINHQTPLRWTYLSHYNSKKAWKTIEYLLERGADINTVDNNGNSLLLDVCKMGRFGDALWLIEHGADVNMKQGIDETTALHNICAATHSDKQWRLKVDGNIAEYPTSKRLVLAKALLDAGADVNAVSAGGQVPLVSAAGSCHVGLVEMLLKHGANPNAHAENGRTALIAACSAPVNISERSIGATIDALLAYGASIHETSEDGRTVLDALLESRPKAHCGTFNESVTDRVRVLLQSGVSPDNMPAIAENIVLKYFMGGYLACSSLLIEHGAKAPEPCDLKKMIGHAIKEDDPEAMQFTLSFERARRLIATPSRLFTALKTGADRVVGILLDNGAPSTYVTRDGTTCLHHACAKTSLDLNFHRRLLESGCDPNALNTKALTPLKAAIEIQRLELVELLLEHGADPDLVAGGSSPLLMATTLGRMDIALALLRKSKESDNPYYRPWLIGNPDAQFLPGP